MAVSRKKTTTPPSRAARSGGQDVRAQVKETAAEQGTPRPLDAKWQIQN
jgi:hypothetical protein